MNPNVILCPVELSASATAALAHAVALARRYDAHLHVAHVQGGRPRGQAASELAVLMRAVDTTGVRLSTVALAGNPVTAVTDHARMIAADLVVVSRHGRYGVYWRPGVYAKDLARALPCPTLAVPDAGSRSATSSFDNILIATDFSAASTAALQKALALAQQSGGRLTLLHVLEGFPYGTVYSGAEAFRLIGEYRAHADRIARQMRGDVPADALIRSHVDTRVASGVAHRAIAATASELNADLIVMGLPARRKIDRVIMGSTAAGVLRSAECPVLFVPGEVTSLRPRDSGHRWSPPEQSSSAVFAQRRMFLLAPGR